KSTDTPPKGVLTPIFLPILTPTPATLASTPPTPNETPLPPSYPTLAEKPPGPAPSSPPTEALKNLASPLLSLTPNTEYPAPPLVIAPPIPAFAPAEVLTLLNRKLP